MAYWSQKEMDKRIAEKRAAIFAERSELFKRFRAGGWEIDAVDPARSQFNILPKNDLRVDVHFRVKMPGAHPMRIKTVEQLRRLVKGVADARHDFTD